MTDNDIVVGHLTYCYIHIDFGESFEKYLKLDIYKNWKNK